MTTTMKLRAQWFNGPKMIPAKLVAPGLAVARALEEHWVKGKKQVWQMKGDYWIYHMPSGLPITGFYMTEEKAIELAETFASWTDIDWTGAVKILGLNKDLKSRVQQEVDKRMPKWR